MALLGGSHLATTTVLETHFERNELLTAVKLQLYQEQAGSLSLPLLDVETGRLLTDDSRPENR